MRVKSPALKLNFENPNKSVLLWKISTLWYQLPRIRFLNIRIYYVLVEITNYSFFKIELIFFWGGDFENLKYPVSQSMGFDMPCSPSFFIENPLCIRENKSLAVVLNLTFRFIKKVSYYTIFHSNVHISSELKIKRHNGVFHIHFIFGCCIEQSC
jgi:hypothetical protein